MELFDIFNLILIDMKTLDKQLFARLVLDIYSGFLRSYQYDSFYDIKRLRTIEENSKETSFHLYFRRSGSDLLFDTEDIDNLHKTYINRNNLCLYVNYIPNIDHNSDSYKIQIVKDEYSYLLWNDILKEF